MIPTSLSRITTNTICLLVLLTVISSAAALSAVGNGNEFRLRSGTSFTRTHGGFGVVLPNSFSFRMNYRNGHDESHSQQRIASSSLLSSTGGNLPKAVGGARPSASASASLEEDQDTSKKVDEYLEFLDKRYNRMRGGEEKKPFSVLQWLHHEDHTDHSEETQSNAFYALGVAGLASERLLQKHGVHLTQCSVVQPLSSSTTNEEEDSIVVDCDSSLEATSPVDHMSLLLNKIFATFAAKIVSLHRQFMVRRHLMLKSLSHASRAVGKKALALIPKASSDVVRALIKAGGGERNLKIAATAVCAFAIYIAQPLVKSAIASRTHG